MITNMTTQTFISKIRLFSYDEVDKDRISLNRNFVKATRRNDGVKTIFHIGREFIIRTIDSSTFRAQS